MVIVIHQTKSTQNAFLYNEKKVEQKVATFFHSRNTKAINPFFYNKSHRLKEFTDIEKLNPCIKNKCFHVSFNPSQGDYLKLGDKAVRVEIEKFMVYMGYGNQPWLVYKHKDLERTHFHIVSTRIDHQTGKKIKDNHERQKAQNFIKEFELRHQLDTEHSREEPVFKFSATSRNIKQSLEDLFQHLNQMNSLNSKGLYDEALKLFNVEIRKSGRGHIVVVTNGDGKVIRYPIRLSKFTNQPKFKLNKKQEAHPDKVRPREFNKARMDLMKDVLKELQRQFHSNDMDKISNRNHRLKRKTKKRKR
jgi:hypothetical protein